MRFDLLLQPSSDQGGDCGQMNSPNYVNNCNYDGAYNVLAKVNIIIMAELCRLLFCWYLMVHNTVNECMSLNFRPWDPFKTKIRVKALTNMI